MDRKQKMIVWLFIFIFLIIVFAAVGTYAFITWRDYKYIGNFGVDINSKGVDTFLFHSSKPASIRATANNFAPGVGHDLKASATIMAELHTTNESAKYCYEIFVILPDTEVFEYSKENEPELVLNVSKKINDGEYTKIISDLDITTVTGTIKVPIEAGSSSYLNEIKCQKNETRKENWKAELTLKYLNDVDQQINDQKEYSAILKANRVEC